MRLKAEAEKAELRAQLLRQFSLVLETRDTARGLIVNMSDVLFDTAKYSLRPAAREKLAKVAGIISGHPGLKLEVEGHTDNVGGDDYNQKLSEQRGERGARLPDPAGNSVGFDDNARIRRRRSPWSRTTLRPAGNRIAAWNWLSPVKSSAGRSARLAPPGNQ